MFLNLNFNLCPRKKKILQKITELKNVFFKIVVSLHSTGVVVSADDRKKREFIFGVFCGFASPKKFFSPNIQWFIRIADKTPRRVIKAFKRSLEREEEEKICRNVLRECCCKYLFLFFNLFIICILCKSIIFWWFFICFHLARGITTVKEIFPRAKSSNERAKRVSDSAENTWIHYRLELWKECFA